MKTWKSEEKGDDKIIAYFNDAIYKVSPKSREIEQVLFDFSNDKPPTKDYLRIPQNYIKEISLEEGKNYIVVSFGENSYEHLRINDSEKRIEIFEYFRNTMTNSIRIVDEYSALTAGKKPLMAMCVILISFLCIFYISYEIEQGNNYGGGGWLSRIIVGIAMSGTKTVLLIFGSLLGLSFISFILKTRKPKVIQRIIMN
jgi:hypothetical protein